jgi:hypothetical protein
LSDWGIRPLSVAESRVAEASVRDALAVPSWAVGTWKYEGTVRQERVQMTIALRSDWSYAYSLRIADASGEVSEGSSEGTFQIGSRDLVFTPSTGKDKGTPTTRNIESQGGYLWIKFREFGDYQLPFAKSKPEPATAAAASTTTAPAPVTTVAPSPTGRPNHGQDSDRGQRNSILPRVVNRGRK